jgi:hypothetical protein
MLIRLVGLGVMLVGLVACAPSAVQNALPVAQGQPTLVLFYAEN